MSCQFHYGLAAVKDFSVSSVKEGRHNTDVTFVQVHGYRAQGTDRFWQSLSRRFRLSDGIFRYFSHEEVLTRVSERVRDDTVRFCIEQRSTGSNILAVSNPDRPVVHPQELRHIICAHGGDQMDYHEGILRSVHVPKSGDSTVTIGPDVFQNRFVLETPVDGFGNPQIYLSVLRLVCSNGLVGYAPAFRSQIQLGNDPMHSVVRALDSYDSDEGYGALRQRLDRAQQSWASLNEVNRIYRVVLNLQSKLPSTVLEDFMEISGRPWELVGEPNLDNLPVKKQRVLPARCRVYDLLNFMSELATHRTESEVGRSLQAQIGELLCEDYDLEGTVEILPEFRDIYVSGGDSGPPVSLN